MFSTQHLTQRVRTTAASLVMATNNKTRLSISPLAVVMAGGDALDIATPQQQQQQQRWFSNSGGKKKKSPGGGYYARLDRSRQQSFRPPKKNRDPMKTPLPRIDKSQIRIRDALDLDEDEDDLTPLGTLMGGALRALRANDLGATNDLDDVEAQLKTMDFLTSADGSTEDLVGARRALTADARSASYSAEEMMRRIDDLVNQERFDYMELPETRFLDGNDDDFAGDNGAGAENQIPPNQLAHGDW